MSQKLAVPRGTRDVLPAEWRLRQRVLDVARRHFERAGFGHITTPTFEDTALFSRGVGESTDIVGKEMYTFTDRSERSLTLRPEGTAPVARAFIAEGMHREPLPVKLWYYAPMFRYEAPQKGRYREHYQVGGEIFGSPLAAADAELIVLLAAIYRELEVPGVTLRLNSIGDENCRPAYRSELVDYLESREGELCGDCRERIKLNPLRVFDCKNESCRAVAAAAPKLADHLCADCAEHFAQVRACLDAASIDYTLDDGLVRGLDYYTRTTFEFISQGLGAQDAIGGGGRYDLLVETLGGPATPGVGFGCGIERLVLALQSAGQEAADASTEVYICMSDETIRAQLLAVAAELRVAGCNVELDLMARSMKGQLKQAARLRAQLALIADEQGLRIHAMQGRQEWPTTIDTAVVDTAAKLQELTSQ